MALSFQGGTTICSSSEKCSATPSSRQAVDQVTEIFIAPSGLPTTFSRTADSNHPEQSTCCQSIRIDCQHRQCEAPIAFLVNFYFEKSFEVSEEDSESTDGLTCLWYCASNFLRKLHASMVYYLKG